MRSKSKDKLIIIISIIAIIALAAISVNIDRIFPQPEAPNPLKYDSSALESAAARNIALGNPDAAVNIIEFSDFRCPWCATAAPAVEQIVAEYGDRIHFEFKHMAGHLGSQVMAEASECAKSQGMFWEYHHMLFTGNPEGDSDLFDYAEGLGLDTAGFEYCLANGKMTLKVENDFEEALSLGITGTPSFIINGNIYPGALSYEKLKSIIEEELADGS